MRQILCRALDQFLSDSQQCTYLNPETGDGCVNTRIGHAKGHQSASGSFIGEGAFVDGAFCTDRFLEKVNDTIVSTIRDMNKSVDGNNQARLSFAAERHRALLGSMPDRSFWTEIFSSRWMSVSELMFRLWTGSRLALRASVCYACLFGRPEYTLPCSHVICFDCIKEFDETPPETKYPGTVINRECVLCSSRENKVGTWPYCVEYQPDLGGIRVLSLDGGGVRGVIQLSILKRLESLVDLDMPLGEHFDMIVGTSVGKSNNKILTPSHRLIMKQED